MKTKIIKILTIMIIISSILSGCVEKKPDMPDVDYNSVASSNSSSAALQQKISEPEATKALATANTSKQSLKSTLKTPEIEKNKNKEAYAVVVVITPPLEEKQEISASEIPVLTIDSPIFVFKGEDFTIKLALETRVNQKIIGTEVNISTDQKTEIVSSEVISTKFEADKIIRGGDISYADNNGITGEFVDIKFSAAQRGLAVITVKVIVVDENLLSSELVSEKTILIV